MSEARHLLVCAKHLLRTDCPYHSHRRRCSHRRQHPRRPHRCQHHIVVVIIVVIILVIVTIIVRLRSDPDLTPMFSLIQRPEIIFGVDVGVIPQIFSQRIRGSYLILRIASICPPRVASRRLGLWHSKAL